MERKVAFTYNGIEVTLGENCRFYVEPIDKHYDTAVMAREAIDKFEKNKESIKREKLTLAVISERGNLSTLTGFHLRNGSPLTSPKLEEHEVKYIYPTVPWIVDAMKKIVALRDEADSMMVAIRSFRLAEPRVGWSEEPDMEKLSKSAKENYAALVSEAESTDLQSELARHAESSKGRSR